MAKTTPAQRQPKSSLSKAVKVLAVVLLVGAAGVLAWRYYELKQDNDSLRNTIHAQQKEIEEYKKNPEAAAQAEVERIVSEVGGVYDLPADETPSVATVRDKDKLTEQPFFAKAENGDITLIYQNSRLAILYRPSTKKVVNVSSVVIEDQNRAAP